MIELRPMTVDDVALIEQWDADPDVAIALGGRAIDWYDWPLEIARDAPWQELLIAEEDGRAIGFVQVADAYEDEEHYWGDVEPHTWTIDIWLGSPADRGRGLGTQVMQAALRRNFDQHGAETVLIDPRVDNMRAIAFYRCLGFEPVEERDFEGDLCLVMRIERERFIDRSG